MLRSCLILIGALLFVSTPALGQQALGLSFNGQLVVPAGQLESFVYEPAQNRISATTFFGDIRCTPGDQSGTGQLVMELDKVSGKEPEAAYQLFSDGSVQYDIVNGVINVRTSAISSSPNCTHFIPAIGAISQSTGEAAPGAFWVSDFESPFGLEATVISPATIGGTLTIRFTLTNISEFLVGTDILAQFNSEIAPLDPGISTPTFSPATAVVGNSWRIPILWPGESGSIDVSYSLGAQTQPGVRIETAIDAVTSLDRTGSEPLATGAVQLTVVNTSTAQ